MRARHLNLVLFSLLVVGLAGPLLHRSTWAAGSTTGVGGSMPAYYDHQLFTINFAPLTTAQATLLAKNGQQNTIYQSDPGLPGGAPFISVIDAIPGDGMNPLWAEVQIAFTAGHTPRQLFSDDEIAAAFKSGEITLTPTNEMYRCAVTGVRLPLPTRSTGTASFGGRSAAGPARPSGTAAAGAQSSSWGAVKATYR